MGKCRARGDFRMSNKKKEQIAEVKRLTKEIVLIAEIINRQAERLG